jgi:hypothetical protein
MENQIINLIQNIENTEIKKFQPIEKLMTLENYMDLTNDKNLDLSLYKLFGYDDDEIFEMDYKFMIDCIYTN